ncbi:hypothetical protein C4D60_Mb07t04450 [Musa balbisiana]|uniref:Uncharacterized protein n=1 Tax=Musa balbisiana TaxID=52838 RepID=A0A4S8JDF2_MUSBA|nr:hypothetical protein C4D60_Mb07t04450 [Musa balbisiana]
MALASSRMSSRLPPSRHLLSLPPPPHGFFGLVFLQQMRRIGIVQTTPTVRRSADRAAHSPPHLSPSYQGLRSNPPSLKPHR